MALISLKKCLVKLVLVTINARAYLGQLSLKTHKKTKQERKFKSIYDVSRSIYDHQTLQTFLLNFL